MSKVQNEKSKFRASAKWKRFRQDMKKERKVDALTLYPLRAGFNLHHMCLTNDMNIYQTLNPECFETLNKTSHDLIHDLFRYFEKDETILDRLSDILHQMKWLTEHPEEVKE